MSMPLAVPRYTLRDLASFPDDGCRYELVDGLLLVTPGPASSHEIVRARLIQRLNVYLQGSPLLLYAQGTVEREPATHLEPDILVAPDPTRSLQIGPETKWTELEPGWLAVEISGRGSRVYDRDFKVSAYLALGVHQVWRIDLEDRCAYVSRPDGTLEIRETSQLTWHPPGMAEPLRIPIEALFAGTHSGDGSAPPSAGRGATE